MSHDFLSLNSSNTTRFQEAQSSTGTPWYMTGLMTVLTYGLMYLIWKKLKPKAMMIGDEKQNQKQFMTISTWTVSTVLAFVSMCYTSSALENQEFVAILFAENEVASFKNPLGYTGQGSILVNKQYYDNNYQSYMTNEVNGTTCMILDIQINYQVITGEKAISSNPQIGFSNGFQQFLYVLIALITFVVMLFFPQQSVVQKFLGAIIPSVVLLSGPYAFTTWDVCFSPQSNYISHIGLYEDIFGVAQTAMMWTLLALVVSICYGAMYAVQSLCCISIFILAGYMYRLVNYLTIIENFFPKVVFLGDVIYHYLTCRDLGIKPSGGTLKQNLLS